jgi:tRNA U34 2-thiouridine synthase MnmA/TrmU
MAGDRYSVTPSLFSTLPRYANHDVGHYARKGWKASPGSSIPRPQLLRSSDPTKDQNYYLSKIPEESLGRVLFPLGELTKADVRNIAEAAGLPTAKRNESMGICFVGQKRRFDEFLCGYTSI